MTTMTPPLNDAIEQKALTTTEQARMIIVTNIQDRARAAEVGCAIAALDKEAENFFAPMKQAAAKTHREICARENSVREPLKAAKAYLSNQIGGFDQRMETERRREEARLQEEARKAAEAIAKRAADEQAIQDAIELEAAGDTKGATAVLNNPVPQPVFVPPVIIPRQVPKSGVSGSQIWRFRIVDATKIPREYLIPDEKLLGQLARAMKDKCTIPGIEVYLEGGARFSAQGGANAGS